MVDKNSDESMTKIARRDAVFDDERNTREVFEARIEDSAFLTQDFKERCRLNFDFYAGDQWDADVKDDLFDEDRPALVFNHTLAPINSVTGSEQLNRFTSRAEPRRVDAQQTSDMVNGTIRYMRDQTDSEFHESDSFQDCIITGLGVVSFSQDYFETHEGRTRVDHVNLFQVMWDPHARQTNLMDRKWDAYLEWWTVADAISQWPDLKDEIKEFYRSSQDTAPREGEEFSGFYADGTIRWVNRDLDEILVYRYQYIQLENYWLVLDEEKQKRMPMSVDEYKMLRDAIEDQNDEIEAINPQLIAAGEQPIEYIPPPKAVRLQRKVYYTAYFIGDLTLEDGPSEIQNGFLLKFFTCFKHKKEDSVDWFGLMDVMRDPADFANKMLSQLSHIVNTNPKGSLIAEDGALKDPDHASENMARPNGIVIAADGALTSGRIDILKSVYPESQDKLYQIAVEAVTRVIGFSPYQLNQTENLSRTNQAAFKMVQQNSQVMLSQPFDALKMYRKEAARTYVEFMDAFMTEGQLIRIQSPMQPPEVVEFKREWIDNMEWDIIFDQTPATATAMEELWDGLNRHGGMEVLMSRGVISNMMLINMIPNIPESMRNDMRTETQKNDMVGQAVEAASTGNGVQALALLQAIAEEMGIEGGKAAQGPQAA